MSERTEEWVAGAGTGGCLSTLPSVPGLLSAAVATFLGDLDGHTSSVLLVTSHAAAALSGSPQSQLSPVLPHRHKWQQEEAPGTHQVPEQFAYLDAPTSSILEDRLTHSHLPVACWKCQSEPPRRKFYSEMPTDPKGKNFITTPT